MTSPVAATRLFTVTTACAWRDTPAGAPPIVTGLRQFHLGRLGVGHKAFGLAGR
jgi:hypothetical protein